MGRRRTDLVGPVAEQFAVSGDRAVRFDAEADDGPRLFVGEELVIDGWEAACQREGTLSLIEGELYPVVIESTNDQGPSFLRLYWSWDGHKREIVVQEALGYLCA